MKYEYSVVSEHASTDGTYLRRPIIEIILSSSKESRKFLGIIDSGADNITMPAAIAEVFGIDRKHCKPWSLMGINMEEIKGFVGQLTIHLQHQLAPFQAPVIFIDTDVPILLGRGGFFDHYSSTTIHTFTLAPKLEVAQSNRDERDITEQEQDRIEHHYNIGIHNPPFGEVIGNIDQTPEETAKYIIEKIR